MRWNGVWFVAAVQYAYTIIFVLCAVAALARAAHFAGHYYIPSFNDAATADADVADGWQWAGVVMAMAALGPVLGMLGVAGSVGLLLTPRVRAYRGQWIMLLISTVLVIAVLIVALSPDGRSVATWVLD
jgi:hypothetical protein